MVLRTRHASGSWRTLEALSNNRLHDPAVGGVLVSARDVTERMEAEERLRHQALHDALTGLPNRTLLHDRLAQGLHLRQRHDQPLALLLLDLDRFKEVNDTLGHHYGDLLLQQVAQRLRGALRASDTVARLGGDEFAIVLPGADATGAQQVVQTLRAVLEEPLVVAGQPLLVGASIGIAVCPEHSAEAATLLRKADVAMYMAKRAGSGAAVYEATLDEHCPRRLALVADLRQAVAQGGLILHYQPKLDLRTGALCGVEALVRWPHPDRGLIPPDQFIVLAEQTGLIAPLTQWVLEAALQQWQRWQRTGHIVPVAVNLSMGNLRDPRLVESVTTLLQQYEVPASQLRLELTESALMTDAAHSLAVLTRLAALGVGLSVDDFGTGYSSLAYLKRLPVDELKIDRAFVQHLAREEADAAIVGSTIGLGHSLGLRVVAEGVEDERSCELLRQWGCDVAQGYYLSRPIPAEALEQWMQTQQAIAA
jgi:diguanylate cyclase (GGDEF)-like protein